MIQHVNRSLWLNETGTELVKLRDNGTAWVFPAACDAKLLDDLAEACTAASSALRLIEETKQQPA